MTDTRWLFLRKDRHLHAVAQVRCGNKTHMIVHTAKGELALEKCHNRQRELNFMALGGKPCRCMSILAMWRGNKLACEAGPEEELEDPYDYKEHRLPEALRREFVRRWEDQAVREHMRYSRPDLLEKPFIERHEHRTLAAAKGEILRTRYARTWDTAIDVAMCLRPGDWQHKVETEQTAVGYRDTSRETIWHFLIPTHWYYKVHRRNLSLIDGHFIMRVVQEDPLLVVAVRQRPNRDLEQCAAWVVETDQGPQLQWTDA